MKTILAGYGMLLIAITVAGCATVSKGTTQDVAIRSTISPDDDAKAVQGNWKPINADFAGQPMTDALLESISLKLDSGKYEVLVGGAPDVGTYTIDSATKPKSMTITGTAGPNNGKIFPAIYELKGDTLRICYDLSGAKRPTEFKSMVGTRLYLVTYLRKKA